MGQLQFMSYSGRSFWFSRMSNNYSERVQRAIHVLMLTVNCISVAVTLVFDVSLATVAWQRAMTYAAVSARYQRGNRCAITTETMTLIK